MGEVRDPQFARITVSQALATTWWTATRPSSRSLPAATCVGAAVAVDSPDVRVRRSDLSQVCYVCGVGEVASRDLRNDTRSVLRRVEAGEEVVITVDGRPVAELHPVGARPRWLTRRQFVDRFGGRQADPGLTDDLRALAPDTTDDLS